MSTAKHVKSLHFYTLFSDFFDFSLLINCCRYDDDIQEVSCVPWLFSSHARIFLHPGRGCMQNFGSVSCSPFSIHNASWLFDIFEKFSLQDLLFLWKDAFLCTEKYLKSALPHKTIICFFVSKVLFTVGQTLLQKNS